MCGCSSTALLLLIVAGQIVAKNMWVQEKLCDLYMSLWVLTFKSKALCNTCLATHFVLCMMHDDVVSFGSADTGTHLTACGSPMTEQATGQGKSQLAMHHQGDIHILSFHAGLQADQLLAPQFAEDMANITATVGKRLAPKPFKLSNAQDASGSKPEPQNGASTEKTAKFDPKEMPSMRQTILVSATLTQTVLAQAEKWCPDARYVTAGAPPPRLAPEEHQVRACCSDGSCMFNIHGYCLTEATTMNISRTSWPIRRAAHVTGR